MTKFSHLTKPTQSKNYFNAKKMPTLKFNLSVANVLIGVFCVMLFVTYLIQVNSLATKGYQIKELERKVGELKQEKADLDLQTLSLQSVGAIKDKVNSLGMVAVNKTEFISDNSVALAR
ncbi:MAG: hypothetical protein WCW26_01450 [Candidatus Buchananbacteria bacterium]